MLCFNKVPLFRQWCKALGELEHRFLAEATSGDALRAWLHLHWACAVYPQGWPHVCHGRFLSSLKPRDLSLTAELKGVKAHPPLFQARKRNPNPNFWVRIFSVWVGVFHVKGWGPKSSVCSSKPGKSNFFGGTSQDFAGISRRCPKSLRKKSLCSIFGPCHSGHGASKITCVVVLCPATPLKYRTGVSIQPLMYMVL